MTKRMCQKDFIGKCEEKHGGFYNYSLVKYVGRAYEIIVICPKHGEFNTNAGNHVNGSGCPKCADETRNKNNKKTHEQAMCELEKRNRRFPPVYLKEGKYTTAKERYLWTCEEGHTWNSKFGDIIRGHGCKICAVKYREKTMLEKYGAKYPLQSKTLRKKFEQNMENKYGAKNPKQQHISKDVLENIKNKEWFYEQHFKLKKSLKLISEETGVGDATLGRYLHSHGFETQLFLTSIGEKEIGDFLTSLNIKYIQSDRTILKPYEIDLHIPLKKIAIELDGIRWHSELYGKDKYYHLNKTKACEEKGIRLIHVWETEWINHRPIVESRLKSLLGFNERIYARKCSIGLVNSNTSKEFLDNTHIQGNKNSSIRLGLFHEDELVALMTFGKSRFNKKYDYELLRFSTKLGINVIGGASRLFSHFIKEFSPKSVISYADIRWNTGNMYSKLGFEHSHNSTPNYYYFYSSRPYELFSRIQFQKHKLEKKLENFDSNLSEWDNMVLNGYDRIWDCGNMVYVWNQLVG